MERMENHVLPYRTLKTFVDSYMRNGKIYL